MEIRVLRYFLAVAREGNITAAANYLHLTQPTLSRQIKDLEEELGVQLLVRKSHNVSLTPDGMRLRKRAEEIVSMVDKTTAEFTSAENTVSGDIYIGGGETRAMHEIAEIIKEVRESYPDIHFHLYSGNAADVTERLDKGLLDFGVLIQPADLSKYNYINLYERDIWGVIMRKDSPLARQEHIKKEDLLDLPLICSRQAISPHQTGNAFSDWFGEDFGKLNIVTTFNLVYNAAIMVDAGIGYAITLDNLADTSEDSNLCFRPLNPKLESGLNIIWKKYQVFSPAAELFLEKITGRFSDLNSEEYKRFILSISWFHSEPGTRRMPSFPDTPKRRALLAVQSQNIQRTRSETDTTRSGFSGMHTIHRRQPHRQGYEGASAFWGKLLLPPPFLPCQGSYSSACRGAEPSA